MYHRASLGRVVLVAIVLAPPTLSAAARAEPQARALLQGQIPAEAEQASAGPPPAPSEQAQATRTRAKRAKVEQAEVGRAQAKQAEVERAQMERAQAKQAQAKQAEAKQAEVEQAQSEPVKEPAQPKQRPRRGKTPGPLQDVPTGRLAEPHPDAPSEMRQFKFLVGEFDCLFRVKTADGVRLSRGRWVGYYTLGGYAFQDDYYSELGFRGTTWRTYDAAKKHWVNHWLMAGTDASPGFATDFFYGSRQGEAMVLKARGSDANGDFIDKIVFDTITKDGFTWTLSRSYDGGRSWNEAVSVNRATRVQ